METFGSETGVEVHPEPVRLNIGAGKKLFEGFLSVGLEDHHDIKTDIRKLPLPDNYADEARAIHVIEHVNRWEVLDMLKDWHRVLKPGGLLVIEQPELRRCCKAILKGLPDQEGMWGLLGDPGHKDELMMHRWCYREDELHGLLREAGFSRTESKEPQFHGKRVKRDMRIEAWK